ncbi:MAG: response regulator [Acidobacteriota bacterium]|jgi:CheY-like chemotaxis protein/predicted regulator of Ras-like GTPase activity (Roadblock/LC7/MglB family)
MSVPEPTLQRISVTVIDDSPTVCRAIESTLSSRGAKVTSHACGLEALKSLPTVRPDLVLCDILLPDIKGFEVCSTIRRTPALRECLVVLISGVVDEEVHLLARSAGAVGLLAKPFTDAQLISVVRRVLERHLRPGSERRPTPGVEPESPLGRLIRELRAIDGFEHGLLFTGNGDPTRFGQTVDGSTDLLEDEANQVLALCSRLADRLDHEGMVDLLLETPTGTVLVDPVGSEGLLIASFESSFALGRMRLALRRYRSRVERAGSPANRSITS